MRKTPTTHLGHCGRMACIQLSFMARVNKFEPETITSRVQYENRDFYLYSIISSSHNSLSALYKNDPKSNGTTTNVSLEQVPALLLPLESEHDMSSPPKVVETSSLWKFVPSVRSQRK